MALFSPLETSVGGGGQAFPGKDGGRKEKFLSDAGARGLAEPESAKIMAQPGYQLDGRVAAKERRRPASGAER